MVSPNKFAHVVYKTHKYEEMIQWYVDVFGAKIQNKTDRLAFLTYDDEHHRFAFINIGPAGEDVPEATTMDRPGPGVHHVAYTWETLDGLFGQYKDLKARGVMPQFCVRHGPTLSMYYADPEGNGMEFQVDLLEADEANAFMQTEAFTKNNIGEPFDPEELIQKFEAGEPLAKHVLRSDQEIPKEGFALSLEPA